MSDEKLTSEERCKFAQGAKVRRKYVVEPAHSLPMRASLSEAETVNGEAYRLAITNRHKPWARRYLRERRYL